MKKINLLLILLVFGVFFGSLSAQRVYNKHKLGIWAEGGEWSMMMRNSELKNSLGGGGAVGFAYELQRKHFLFDVGIGAFGGQTKYDKVPDQKTSLTVPKKDDILQENGFEFCYAMRERQDVYTEANLQVPVLLGGNWHRFYFLAGAVVNVNIWNQCAVTGVYDTYGDYLMWDDFHNMPEYEFVDNRDFNGTTRGKFNIDIDAAVEIGARLGYIESGSGWDVPKSKVEYRLAVFANYGLLDYHAAQQNTYLNIPSKYNPKDMTSGLSANDILSTQDIAKAVNNLLVGVKFTVFFPVPEKKKCVSCPDTGGSHYRGRTKILEELIF